jgi:hypothetical protein
MEVHAICAMVRVVAGVMPVEDASRYTGVRVWPPFKDELAISTYQTKID